MNTSEQLNTMLEDMGITIMIYSGAIHTPKIVIDTFKHDNQIMKDAVNNAIHRLYNLKATCHEDYVDGIEFAIGVLMHMLDEIKGDKKI